MEVAAIDLPEATTTTEQPTSCFATMEQLGINTQKKDRLQLRVQRQLFKSAHNTMVEEGHKGMSPPPHDSTVLPPDPQAHPHYQ